MVFEEIMYINVKIDQAGGKYGTFPCPKCQRATDYKFSAASGWCDGCGSTFYYTGGIHLHLKGQRFTGPHLMQLEMNYTEHIDL